MASTEEQDQQAVVVCSSESCEPKLSAAAASSPLPESLPINATPLSDAWRFLPEEEENILFDKGAIQCLGKMEKHGAYRLSTIPSRSIFRAPVFVAPSRQNWHQKNNAHLTIGQDAVHHLCCSVYQFVAGIKEYTEIKHLPRKLPVAMPWSATRGDFVDYERVFTFKPDGSRELLFWTGHELWGCSPDWTLRLIHLDGMYKKRLSSIPYYFLLDGEFLDPRKASTTTSNDEEEQDPAEQKEMSRGGDEITYFLVSDILALHGYWCGPMAAIERIKLALQFTYTLNEGRAVGPGLNILAKEFFFQKDYLEFKDRIKTSERDGKLFFEHAATRIPFDTDVMIAIRPELSYSQNAQEADRAVVKVNHPVKIDLQVTDIMRVAYGSDSEESQSGTWSLKRLPPVKIQHELNPVPMRTFVSLAAALPSKVKTATMPHGPGYVCLPFHDMKISPLLSKKLAKETLIKGTPLCSHARSLQAVHFIDTLGFCDCEFSIVSGKWKLLGFQPFQPVTERPMMAAHQRAMAIDLGEDVKQRTISLIVQKGSGIQKMPARLCLVHHDVEKCVVRLGYRGLHPVLEKARQSRQVLSGLKKVETLPPKGILKQIRFTDDATPSPPEMTYEPIFGEQNIVPIGIAELRAGDKGLARDLGLLMRTKRKAICTCVLDIVTGIWAILGMRDDKDSPNFHSTVMGCLLSMASDLTLDVIGNVLLDAQNQKKAKTKTKTKTTKSDDVDGAEKRKRVEEKEEEQQPKKKKKKKTKTVDSSSSS